MYTQGQQDRLVKTLLDGKAVRCETEDQSYELSEILNDAGICWVTGESMLQRRVWNDYGERTAYNYVANREGMMYGTAEWYEEHGREVVDFDEIITSEPQSAVSLMEYMSL